MNYGNTWTGRIYIHRLSQPLTCLLEFQSQKKTRINGFGQEYSVQYSGLIKGGSVVLLALLPKSPLVPEEL